MITKEKITLTHEQETLLIPLYSKARANTILVDEKACQILESVQYDFSKLKIPEKTQVTLRMRAKKLDMYTADFIKAHPDALVIHLGCGLDSRGLRVPRAQSTWVDLDLPEVIVLRRKFYDETVTNHMVAGSATDPAWMERVSSDGQPVFVVAEGLLMYLRESEVRALILGLHRRFPGCEMVFDAFSKLTAERIRAHPSIQRTGAEVHWGIDDPHEIEGWAEDGGIRLKEEWFFSQSTDIARLGWFYRFMFGLTKGIKAAQRAQRLLYYKL